MYQSWRSSRFGGCSLSSTTRAMRAAAALLAFVLAGSIHAGEAAAQWRFETTPFLWASGQHGNIDFRNFRGDLDIGLGDLLSEVDGAFMLPVEGHNGRWGVGFEIVYIDLSDQDADAAGFQTVDYQASHQIIELSPRYTLGHIGKVGIAILAGGRYMRVDNEFTLGSDSLQPTTLRLRDRWIEPLAGLRARAAVSRWTFVAHSDVGGFGLGSDVTWQAYGYAGYRFGPRLTLRAGYRYFDVNFEDDDDAFQFDVAMRGLMIGASFSF